MTQHQQFLDNLHKMHKLNSNKRDTDTVKIHKFMTEFVDKNPTVQKMITFLESPVKHALITASTQVGKTNAVIQMIKECMSKNVAVIVFSKKVDQRDQFMERIRCGLMGLPFELLTASNKLGRQARAALDEGLMPVTFCLDNYAQVAQVNDAYFNLMRKAYKNHVKQIVIIHTDKNRSKKAQQELVDMIYDIENEQSEIKQVFATLSPNNCISNKNLKNPYIIDNEL